MNGMNIRRLVLDADKAVAKSTVTGLAEAICGVAGVEAVNITVTEIDIETVGVDVTIFSRFRAMEFAANRPQRADDSFFSASKKR